MPTKVSVKICGLKPKLNTFHDKKMVTKKNKQQPTSPHNSNITLKLKYIKRETKLYAD